MTRPPFKGDRDALIAEAAAGAARIFAPKETDASESPEPVIAKTVTARFLALGDAHVIVTRDSELDEMAQCRWQRVACEACGPLLRNEGLSDTDALKHAQKHAETCRRIPERLWPKDGAR